MSAIALYLEESDALQPGLVADLLEADCTPRHPNGLPGCMGDDYLCTHNSVFAAVRRMALEQGTSFLSGEGPLVRTYRAAPLFSLPRILETGQVPYLQNRAPLRELMSTCPSLELRSFVKLCAPNVAFHESGHYISYRLLTASGAPRLARSSRMNDVLILLLCESFAIAIERIAAALADDPCHQAMYALNSYLNPMGKAKQASAVVRKALDGLGMEAVFPAVIFTLLFYNVHDGDLSEFAEQTIIALGLEDREIGPSEVSLLQTLIRTGLPLNTSFRNGTTPVFFRYIDRYPEFEEISRTLFTPGNDKLLCRLWECALGLSHALSGAGELEGVRRD